VTPEASDNALALSAAGGDRRAFAVLLGRHSAALLQAARGFGLPESDVDDVVQEAFVAAWRNLAAYDPDRPFRAWLFRIAVNKMRDLRRHRRVRRFLFGASALDDDEAITIADDAPDPERQAIARAELQRTRAMLNQLDRELREALVLTAIVGLSQPEAAVALGTSGKAIEGRVARARRRLAVILEKN
jgi:RNA polymerase sigma-70 factor (ECF subfamily)